MCKIAKAALGICVASTVVYLIIHRRVVAAVLKGEPVPELPEWHKAWHPCSRE